MIGEKEKRQKNATYSHLYQSEFTPAVRQIRHPNANGADSRAFVHNSGYKEAAPLMTLLRRRPARIPEDERRRIVEATITLYAHRMLIRPARAVVIKFNDVGIVSLPRLLNWWPGVRAVVLVREPIEVIASNIQHPTGFLRSMEESPAVAGRLFGWTERQVRRMSNEERCARVIGRIQEIALASLGDRCRVIDYSELNAKRIREVAGFLGADVASPGSEALDDVMANYSKDSTKSKPFSGDSEEKQKSASLAAKQAAERWALTSYRALRDEARLGWQESGVSQCIS